MKVLIRKTITVFCISLSLVSCDRKENQTGDTESKTLPEGRFESSSIVEVYRTPATASATPHSAFIADQLALFTSDPVIEFVDNMYEEADADRIRKSFWVEPLTKNRIRINARSDKAIEAKDIIDIVTMAYIAHRREHELGVPNERQAYRAYRAYIKGKTDEELNEEPPVLSVIERPMIARQPRS